MGTFACCAPASVRRVDWPLPFYNVSDHLRIPAHPVDAILAILRYLKRLHLLWQIAEIRCIRICPLKARDPVIPVTGCYCLPAINNSGLALPLQAPHQAETLAHPFAHDKGSC